MKNSSESEKKYHKILNSGDLFVVDEEFVIYEHEAVSKINGYNTTPDTPEGLKKREEILREAMGTYGEGLYIIPPVNANKGLSHVHVGKNVSVNFNSSFVDEADIFIGDDTMIGPNVQIITALHPISPKLRIAKFQYNKEVHIGKNVWIGAGAIIFPGVNIGDNSVVGAGSIVTKDVESNTIVVGNPAKLLRKIDEKDDEFFDKGKKIPDEIIRKYIS